ncbi:MAG: hypothetical protein IKB37_01960 [Rikenellaceae bacterium]|nr:hypothetical protein [Rikenellaceae bacterium]
MKKSLVAFCIACFLVSCGSPLRLTGTYPSTNHFGYSDKSYEQVWAKVIDYFAIAGIPITTIDKSSGLIVSSKVSFLNYYTREVKGAPLNPNAYVVIPTVRSFLGNILEPTAVITGDWTMVGDWNVRIRESNGKIMVNVNLMNLDCYYKTSSFYSSTTKVPIKSTGKFESELLDFLTK